MKHISSAFILVLMLASLAVTACTPKSTKAEKIQPFRLEVMEAVSYTHLTLPTILLV